MSSLDTNSGEATVDRDISDYIYSRCVSQSAFSLVHRAEEENFLDVFASHLVKKASGCFLYVKMMVEFIEGGQIVIIKILVCLRDSKAWSQLVIFPEGATTNGKAILTFKAGGFIPGVTVQPEVGCRPQCTLSA